MNPFSKPGRQPGAAAAWPAATTSDTTSATTSASPEERNVDWEVDRLLSLERSERRAWWIAGGSTALTTLAIAAVFVQGPLRRVVEVPIVVDRLTGEATIQQRLSEETIPPLEALDKHNLAAFVRAREGYNWPFLQRDYDQVARMAVPAVFTPYGRQFEGEDPLHKRLAGNEVWKIQIVGVRLGAGGRTGNRGEGIVTYEKTVQHPQREQQDVTTRHVASVVFEYQPKILAKERDRVENPFGFVVTAYRSDPEIATVTAGVRP